MVAGPDPWEEIRCIQNALPQCHITAVDLIQENVDVAISAGADRGVCVDLSQYTRNEGVGRPVHLPPEKIGGGYDVICLDMTCLATPWLKQLIAVYFRAVTTGGFFIVNFSYGHDVVEYLNKRHPTGGGLPDYIPLKYSQRIAEALDKRTRQLVSVFQYTGNKIPMLSCGLERKYITNSKPSVSTIHYEQLGKDDFDKTFEVLLTDKNIADLLGVSLDCVLAKKRSMAAKKAGKTRKSRERKRHEG